MGEGDRAAGHVPRQHCHMAEELPREKLLKCYQAVFGEIASKIEEQTALEAHQLRAYSFPFREIQFGRADTYEKIARIVKAFQPTEEADAA